MESWGHGHTLHVGYTTGSGQIIHRVCVTFTISSIVCFSPQMLLETYFNVLFRWKTKSLPLSSNLKMKPNHPLSVCLPTPTPVETLTYRKRLWFYWVTFSVNVHICMIMKQGTVHSWVCLEKHRLKNVPLMTLKCVWKRTCPHHCACFLPWCRLLLCTPKTHSFRLGFTKHHLTPPRQ